MMYFLLVVVGDGAVRTKRYEEVRTSSRPVAIWEFLSPVRRLGVDGRREHRRDILKLPTFPEAAE
jgi:hypothetical protein